MFQSFAFQNYAFQTAVIANDNTASGKYTYQTPYQRLKIEQLQEKVRREKTELQRLDSVLAENQRKAAILEKSKADAKEAAVIARLAKLELEYLNEINRLMRVRALLLLRIKQNEEAMIVLLAMMRRRLRA